MLVLRASLPVDACLAELRAALASHRAAVVVAPPGSGKTTRVPPAVADAGRVVVLQPRRVAARSVARRIADEQGWTLGREVGWHVRFDRRFTADTRVLLVTEGMLTHYLDEDPLLTGVSTVILDEFHERSLHTDLGLALVAEAWRARRDLRVIVMSATMDPRPVRAYLDDCPLVAVSSATHPLDVIHAPGETVVSILPAVLASGPGDVLCFLPGAGEIERALQEARGIGERHGLDLLPLHGSLGADAQDRALVGGSRRRVVMATNIAETSLTVPGVSMVVDGGWQKVARYDAERAIDTLVPERVTADSAAQRAGRAARLGPGRAWQLWDARDRLRPTREPEIERVDLAGMVLGLMAAGHAPESFRWFEAPSPERVQAARELLERLGAIEGPRVTARGHQLRRLPLHPRIASVLIAAGGAWEAAAACALLSEGRPAVAAAATTCDLLPLIDQWPGVPPHTRQVADAVHRLGRSVLGDTARDHVDDVQLRRALLAGFPDRVARRRANDRSRLVLASGRGATMGRESAVMDGEWLVALDLTGGRPGQAEALVRMASRVEPDWLTPTARAIEHRLDDAGSVKAFAVSRYHAIVMAEHPVAADPVERARLLAAAWRERPMNEAAEQLLRRARFAGIDLDLVGLSEAAAASARSIHDLDIATALSWDAARALESSAPASLAVPSGRSARLEYREDGTVYAAVKLQELFGLAETPRLGPRQQPLVIELLAPNGRPVQTTTDLRSFWTRTYPEVRKELRGRYPKHPWPDDPWMATPTHRTQPSRALRARPRRA
jgi:ATP-dependent helicase HrpB